MILYHVTRDLLHDGTFHPRVPKSRLDDENKTLERVCLSSSIEGCLSAMPGGGDILGEKLEETNGILRVFEVHLPDDQKIPGLYSPKELVKLKYVPDAMVTGEYWMTETFEASNSYLVQITDWKIGEKVINTSWNGIQYKDKIPYLKEVIYTSSKEDTASVEVPYPGDEEWKSFLTLGRKITGKGLRKRKDNRYCTEKCGEEFFFLAANFGTNITIPFKSQLGQSIIPQSGDVESFKLWDGMIIYRDIAY